MAELTNRSSGRGSSRLAAPRVDLTAMVDLAFLLITFFMLTTTLAKQNAMLLSLPVPDIAGGTIADNRAMTILLDDGHKVIWYSGMAENPTEGPFLSTFSKDGIRQEILRQQKNVREKTGKELIVIVKPSDKSQYADLVNILDELSNTNVKQHAVSDPDKDDLALLRKY
jgi:biopolymer transport protein ExbD